jgi:light-regulated signal transduction histidine kinase (bacteriophytochrome)
MFFKKSKQKLEAMEAYRNELDTVKQELEGFKNKIESDLGSIKKDFKELIVLLQESPDEEEDSTENGKSNRETERKEERTPAKIINEILGQSELDEMRTDITSIFEKVIAIARQTDETAKTLTKFKDTTSSELKGIKSNIDNARKDINNKIKYSISRLRT